VIHHAIQCSIPELTNLADHNLQQGIETRRNLLERCAESDMLLMTGHFPDPTVGRVVRHDKAFRFQFEE
jgi:hypothetical protein